MATAVHPHLESASIRPAAVTTGASITLSVATVGDARKVEVYLASGSPGGGGPFTYELTQVSDGSWSTSVAAPSTPGDYHYSVGLFDAAGRRTIADQDAWTITVRSVATVGHADTLPANMPLAPGFSYGNPVPAVFNAAGHVIQGSEVTSTTNASASGSALGQFYATRLPRAGWTVDPSTVPAANATTFSIVATTATMATVVQFSAGTLHIYYGSL